MKQKFLLMFVFCLLSATAFSQSKEARKITEFGKLPCGHTMAYLDNIYQEFKNSPDSKIYVIYYEDDEIEAGIWNKKLRKYETRRTTPIRGTALNLAKAIPLYLGKVYKLSSDKMILIDGGFKEGRVFEIWIVPDGAELPKPTPTVDAKEVKLRKGKPVKTPDYSQCYSDV